VAAWHPHDAVCADCLPGFLRDLPQRPPDDDVNLADIPF
jgi:hypothetical protein